MATKKKPSTQPPAATNPKSEGAKPHQLMTWASAQNALAMEKWSCYGEPDLQALITDLGDRVEKIQGGNMKPIEAMLYGQAQALQAIFTNMSRRSARNAGEYINASETYLKLALKAQSQCRATLETLAIIKNPMPYIKQANIANGPQQVNNGQSAQYAQAPAPAGKFESKQNQLLEDSHGGTYLDTGATAAATRGNPAMETVEQVNRAEKSRR